VCEGEKGGRASRSPRVNFRRLSAQRIGFRRDSSRSPVERVRDGEGRSARGLARASGRRTSMRGNLDFRAIYRDNEASDTLGYVALSSSSS